MIMDRFILNDLRKKWPEFVLLCVVTLLSVLMTLPIPILIQFTIDSILPSGNYGQFASVCLILLVVIVLQLLIGRLNAFLAASYTQGFINRLRMSAMKAFLKSKNNTTNDNGRLMVIMNGDIPLLVQDDVSIASTLCASAFSFLIYVAMIASISPILCAVVMIFLPVYSLWLLRVGKKMRIFNKKVQEINGAFLSRVSLISENIGVIRSYGYEYYEYASFQTIVDFISSFNLKYMMYGNFAGIVSGVIKTSGIIIPFALGVLLSINGTLSIGELILFYSLSGMLFSVFGSMSGVLAKFESKKAYEERLEIFLTECEAKRNDVSSGEASTILANNLQISAGNHIVLSNTASLHLRCGECVMLTGENGSGKSLLLKSISGDYDNYKGDIHYYDDKGDEIERSAARLIMLYVSSEQNLVTECLYDELYEYSKLGMSETNEILEALGLMKKIETLSNGLKTSREDLESKTNKGFLQEIKIVRALTRRPSFLFLDEMFANIQNKESYVFLNTIRTLFPKMCIVVVEHHAFFDFPFDSIYRIEQNTLVKK